MIKKITAVIRLIRIKQWVKNFFVLFPLLFSHKITNIDDVLICIVAFFAFNFISSTIYVINDYNDVEADKNHPRKCKRPLASGEIGKSAAIIIIIVLFIIGISISLFVNPIFIAVLLAYFGLFLLYTFKAKNMVLLDVFFIALGFVLRVTGGSAAIMVEPSGWIIMTTFFLSLFLGFGKRRNEIIGLENKDKEHRKVLDFYDKDLLNFFIFANCGISIISYALYTLSPSVIDRFANGEKLVYTIPFVAYVLFRYIMILWRNKEGDPTEVVFHDPGLIISGVIWVVLTSILLYVPLNFGF
ncbi:MAG: decaprenyl-phosphate phosphoribosyltransferase [Spirochaetales bacterium]|nr:decaprenyl-phosphate phosphoribosyltransferase [Spirochaetales bacterium]